MEVALESRPHPLALDESFILIMRPDPKPIEIVALTEGQSPKSLGNPDRPEITYRLQVERWMGGVLAEKQKLFVGPELNLSREKAVKLPEFFRCMRHCRHGLSTTARIHRLELPAAD